MESAEITVFLNSSERDSAGAGSTSIANAIVRTIEVNDLRTLGKTTRGWGIPLSAEIDQIGIQPVGMGEHQPVRRSFVYLELRPRNQRRRHAARKVQ